MTPTIAEKHGSLPAFATECIREAFLVCNNHLIGEAKGKVHAFLTQLCCGTAAHMLFTTEGSTRMVDFVFGDAAVRDFVLRMSASFHIRFGSNKEQYELLINDLVNAFDFVDNDGNSMIPPQVRDRLPSRTDITDMLKANKWLLVIALCHLYLIIDLRPGNAGRA